jgi:hypothetical protein
MKTDKIDPDFDGHLEKPLASMTPREKLLYMSMQIALRYAIKTKVKKKGDKDSVKKRVVPEDEQSGSVCD